MKSFIILLLVGAAFAATTKPDHEHEEKPVTAPGKCPEFTGAANVDAAKMNGDWFVVKVAKVGIEKSPKTKTCVKKNFVAGANGEKTVTLSFMKDGKTGTHVAKSTPISGQPGKYTVTSDEFPNKTVFATVLDTDNENYSVAVLCKEQGDKHGLIVEVLSRLTAVDAAFHDKIKAALDAAKITAELTPVEQNC